MILDSSAAVKSPTIVTPMAASLAEVGIVITCGGGGGILRINRNPATTLPMARRIIGVEACWASKIGVRAGYRGKFIET